MANRNQQQKMLKNKRRGRFARFSGATTKIGQRTVQVLEQEGEDRVKVKEVSVYVGLESLTKQVINTGRGPDSERMQEYYNRVRPQSFAEEVPKTKSERLDQQLMRDFKCEHPINYLKDELARLDLFFNSSGYFWVEVDYRRKTWRRSAVYKNKKMAEAFLEADNIRWVETISP